MSEIDDLLYLDDPFDPYDASSYDEESIRTLIRMERRQRFNSYSDSELKELTEFSDDKRVQDIRRGWIGDIGRPGDRFYLVRWLVDFEVSIEDLL